MSEEETAARRACPSSSTDECVAARAGGTHSTVLLFCMLLVTVYSLVLVHQDVLGGRVNHFMEVAYSSGWAPRMGMHVSNVKRGAQRLGTCDNAVMQEVCDSGGHV